MDLIESAWGAISRSAGSSDLQANEPTPQFFDNFNNTNNTPHNNSLSVKALYYPDYLALRKRPAR